MAAGLVDVVADDPGRLLISDGLTSLTGHQFNERVNQVMAALETNGVAEGDRFAVLGGNSVDYVVVVIALLSSGVDAVPVNWHLGAAEMAYILESSRCRGLFVDDDFAALGRDAAAQADVEIVLPFGLSLDATLATQSAAEPTPRRFASPVYFTSGTTGRPKGTQMSELKTGVTASAFIADARAKGMGSGIVHLTVGPLYHAGPLTQAIRCVMVGGQLHVMRRFDPVAALAAIDEHRVTDIICVPTHLVRLLRVPDETKERYDVSSMRRVFHIAAMMPPDVKRQMIEWFGPVVSDGYGASEVGVVTLISSEEWLARPGSVGRPIANMSIEIVGDDDEALNPGEVGQIYISNDAGIDISYVDDPMKTAEAHRKPGQFTLGDLGWVDEDGYLYLADRRVDLIISGGVNIYPAEIETELIMHPAVDDVGVFAIPDAEWGHQVKAAVKLRQGHMASVELEAELLEWLRGRVAHYKVPKSIDFAAELPRYSNGKLHRRELRDPYWADHSG